MICQCCNCDEGTIQDLHAVLHDHPAVLCHGYCRKSCSGGGIEIKSAWEVYEEPGELGTLMYVYER